MSLEPEPIEEMVRVARELDDADRAAYLDEVTQGDAALRAKVQAMLAGKAVGDAADPACETAAEPTTIGMPSDTLVRAGSDKGETDGDAPTDRGSGLPAALRAELFEPAEHPGASVGRYRLLQKIGEGGFGVVYMAEQQKPVRRRVALKIIKAGMDTRQVIARFEAERQALAMMDHPFIAKVLDAGATETGRPYFVMELVKGIPITQYCDDAKLGMRERLELFKDICSAIQHAHHKGIIHRDLKPSNVMITLHGGSPVVKVIDFGIAKATDQKLTEKTLFTNYGQMIGTPAYMSPEQAVMSGLDVDTRSDIYSLGILLYELLTGRPPVEDQTLREAGFDEMRRIIRDQDPPKPSTRLQTMDEQARMSVADNRHSNPNALRKQLRGDLDWIVMKALEKDRARRYESASAFAQDIDRFLDDQPVEAAAPTTAYRLRKYVQRHKGPVTAAAALAVILVAGTAVSTWQAIRATDAERTANENLKIAEQERDAKEKAAQDAEAIAAFFSDVLRSPNPRRDGRTITVAETLDRANDHLAARLADQPDRQATLRKVLGDTYKGLGLFDQAVEALEAAHDYFEQTYGQFHEKTLEAAALLADVYHELNRLEEALGLREQIYQHRLDTLGSKDPKTISAMERVATSYYRTNEFDKAYTLRSEALKLCEAVYGREYPATLVAMTNLATSYQYAGKLDEAMRLLQDVVRVYEQRSGAMHPDTLKAMNNLANAYSSADRADQALDIRRRVADRSIQVLGERHPDTLTALDHLATSYRRSGRVDDALEMRERLLDLRRSISGPNDPRTLTAMHNLAVSYSAAGRKDEALRLREQVAAFFEKHLGKQHRNTLVAKHNLANSYQDIERWQESFTLRREVLRAADQAFGGKHEMTVWAMHSMAIALGEHGQVADTIHLLKRIHTARADAYTHIFELAALYAWLNRNDAYALLRDEVLTRATLIYDIDDAQALVRLACLLPMTRPGDDQAVLDLARRRLRSPAQDSILTSKALLAWGMAEQRSTNYTEAVQAYSAATKAAEAFDFEQDASILKTTADLYRAMCLHRLGKEAEALRLFESAEQACVPIPEDPAQPLVGGAGFEAILQWLALREADLLIRGSTAER